MKNIKMLLMLVLVFSGFMKAGNETIIRRPKQKIEQTQKSKEKVAEWRQFYREYAKYCDTGEMSVKPNNPEHFVLTASELSQVFEPDAEGKAPMMLAFEKSTSGYLCELPFTSSCDECYNRGVAMSEIAGFAYAFERRDLGHKNFTYDPQDGCWIIPSIPAPIDDSNAVKVGMGIGIPLCLLIWKSATGS